MFFTPRNTATLGAETALVGRKSLFEQIVDAIYTAVVRRALRTIRGSGAPFARG